MRRRQRKKNFKKLEKKWSIQILKGIENTYQSLADYFDLDRLYLMDPVKEINVLPMPNPKINFSEFCERIFSQIAKKMGVPEKYLKEKR